MKSSPRLSRFRAFTLVECLVACAILGMILAAMLAIVNQASGAWRSANSRVETFQGARRAFETMTSLLGQTTLNTYWGYDDENNPSRYVRKSELHFVVAPASEGGLPGTLGCGQGVFFQAPAGKARDTAIARLTGLLNPCGFYVEYGSDQAWLPAPPIAAPARDRYRLMMWLGNTDVVEGSNDSRPRIFRSKNDTSDATDWVEPAAAEVFPLADNIIALAIWPREQTGSDVLNAYAFNSRTNLAQNPQPVTAHQLPPILEVAMVAIDETSAERLGEDLESVVTTCLEGLFETNPAANFSEDLKTLEGRLGERGITHRVFSSAVPLQSSRWSTQ